VVVYEPKAATTDAMIAAIEKAGFKSEAIGEPTTPTIEPKKSAPADVASGPVDLSEEAQRLTREALSLYEQMRASLAVDKTDNVPALAVKLSTAVKAAGEAAPGNAKAHFAAMAAGAKKVANVAGDAAADMRLAFGEVSRPIVALLSATPTLAKDYHVFECPMASGYKRWIQPNADLSNPYMGTAMPKCGSEVKF